MTPTQLEEEASADAGPGDTEEHPLDESGRRPGWYRPAGAALVLLALIAAVVLGLQARSATVADAEQRAVLVAARQTVVDLTTVDPETAPEVYGRLRAAATDRWGDQLAGQETSFVDAIQQAAVTSRGQITESAVERVDGGAATVLVAATATVTNVETATTPEVRQYRVALDLVRAADDRWLVAGLEFVP